MKRIVVVMCAMLMFVFAVPTFAAASPYKDVTVQTVGKEGVNAVAYVKNYKGYKGIIAGTTYKKLNNGLYMKVSPKFKPTKKVTRGEFLTILYNLYGSKYVPVSATDIKKYNKTVSEAFVKEKLVQVGKKLGIKIQWEKPRTRKLNRVEVASYICSFARFDKAFTPKKR